MAPRPRRRDFCHHLVSAPHVDPLRMAREALSDLQVRLATQIVEHIVKNELASGHHLTEERLAQEFGVSRSPVSRALRYLSRKGVVELLPNRGFFVARNHAELDPGTLGLPASGDQRLYERIVRDRITGKLGDVLTEAEFMRRYKVSRGLLRQVLQQLGREGVIQRTQGYGWAFLPSVDSEQAHDSSYRFRLLIEPAAILEPTYVPNPPLFARLRAEHERVLGASIEKLSRLELFKMNAMFHEGIASCSGNRYFLQAVQAQNHQRQLVEHTGLSDAERVAISCQEHLAILTALEQDERPWAAQLMRRHIEVASKLKLAYRLAAAAKAEPDGKQDPG